MRHLHEETAHSSSHTAPATGQAAAGLTPGNEFMRGAAAAVANILITFPIHKVMFRQQVHGLTARQACQQVWHEGVHNLWRGVAPPLLQRGTSVAVMFATFHFYTDALDKAGLPPMVSTAFAGAASGVSEALLTPFERLQTLLQHQGYDSLKNTLHAVKHCRQHGIMELYRGFSAVLIRCVGTNTAFFAFRKPLKERVLAAWAEDVGAAMSEHTAAGASQGSVPAPSPTAAFNAYHARIAPPFEEVALGTPGSAVTLGGEQELPPSPAVTVVNSYVLPDPPTVDTQETTPRVPAQHRHSKVADFGANFISGGLLGAVVGVVLYPLSVAKALMQSTVGDPRFRSILHTLNGVRVERGSMGMMRGSTTNFARSLLSWGILNAVYEALAPQPL